MSKKKDNHPFEEKNHHNDYLKQMNEVNRKLVDIFQNVHKMQKQYMQTVVKDMAESGKKIMNNKKPIDLMECHKKMSEHVHRAMDHSINVGKTLIEGGQHIHEHLQDIRKKH